MARTTYSQEFELLDDNEKLTVTHLINMMKDDSPGIIEQRKISESAVKPIKDEKILDHLEKIADGYMGKDVKLGCSRRTPTGTRTPREKLEKDSINFTL